MSIPKKKAANIRRVTSRPRGEDRETEMARCAVDIPSGGQSILSPEDILLLEQPDNLKDAFKRARQIARANFFIGNIWELKQDFFNFGLKLSPQDSKDKTKFEALLAENRMESKLLRFCREVAAEFLLQDTVVSFWRDPSQAVKKDSALPINLLPETVKYTDSLGLEKLRVSMGCTADSLKDTGLSAAQIKRYTSGDLELSEDEGEYFQVLTRGMRGHGLSWPGLYRTFRAAAQSESMEAGESAYAQAGRTVIEHHTIGFEVRATGNAHKQAEHLYKRDRALLIKKFFAGVKGHVRDIAQFDHAIKYIWIDPKNYDARKWETIVQRFLWWGGPLAFMYLAKSVSPFLLQMLSVQMKQAREKFVKRHIEEVLNQSVLLPYKMKIKVSYSDRCFTDERLAWKMVEFLTQQGPLSCRTALEEANFNPEEQAAIKRDESRKERDVELMPKFDKNHGNRPGNPNGRTPGAKDGDNQ